MKMTEENMEEQLGFGPVGHAAERTGMLKDYASLKLAARGFGTVGENGHAPFLKLGKSLIQNFQERLRQMSDYLCPVDATIDAFLNRYLEDVPGFRGPDGLFADDEFLIPSKALILERHGLARELSLPARSDKFESEIGSSYRVFQGVLHNPKHDRRTTKGAFHIVAGGYGVPWDKKEVPKIAFAHLLKAALQPPNDHLILPYACEEPEPIRTFASLFLRPIVCPAVDGFIDEKTSEVRFFAPGNLVANLDFVESIFGNAGDPNLPENNARLDPEHWTGHTGCVLLAPHLIALKKKDIGLPHIDDATERQKRDGMCWSSEDDLYNDGVAFKLTCRDKSGVVVTLIADNYFGYCKKEVKTQLSFAANLYGMAEEEHAGGAIAFPRRDLGEDFQLSQFRDRPTHTFGEIIDRFGEIMELQPGGYGIDRRFQDIIYLPETAFINLHDQRITWEADGQVQSLSLQPEKTYVLPSGYKVEMRFPSARQRWRLIGINAEGTFCHKPCTVSGGGKSEISKSLFDAMQAGPVIISSFQEEMNQAESIINHDFGHGDRFKAPREPREESRPILDSRRSLGSVISLLTPSEDFTDEYNAWLDGIPRAVKDLVFTIKRVYKADWGDDWRTRFTVDTINGEPGLELKYLGQNMITQYLRVGFEEDGSGRTFGLRKDFYPAVKLQREDDISASITVPRRHLQNLHPKLTNPAFKFVKNCEYRFFQRPDDAIRRGYDKHAEEDFSRDDGFFCNYEPIPRNDAATMIEDTIRFTQFTQPLRETFRAYADTEKPDYVVSTSNPRIVEGGARSKNPRYLQNRPDLSDQRSDYLAEIGARFFRRAPLDEMLPSPVVAVLPGRRNNPPDVAAGIRPLAVFNPVHHQELPELFMDFIASLTGKSPSTTGAGSEGALTKGPFNMLFPITDLNNALVSFLLTDHHAFSTAAGYIGPKYKVDHDISLLIPEVWCRMFVHERDPKWLIENGYLEKLNDIEHDGKTILASRLGFRITERFAKLFLNRIFTSPDAVFPEDMLRPELQNYEQFLDGINNITETQQKVAMNYFHDGSIDQACPPLNALLHIMAHGHHEERHADHPDIRAMFTREAMLESDWYRERIDAKATVDHALLSRHQQNLETFLNTPIYATVAQDLDISTRLKKVKNDLAEVGSDAWKEKHQETLGTDPAIL